MYDRWKNVLSHAKLLFRVYICILFIASPIIVFASWFMFLFKTMYFNTGSFPGKPSWDCGCCIFLLRALIGLYMDRKTPKGLLDFRFSFLDMVLQSSTELFFGIFGMVSLERHRFVGTGSIFTFDPAFYSE